MKADESNLLWIDLEMSGLEPELNQILEIATIVTSKDLGVIAMGPELAIHQPDEVLDGMDDWNREHHDASGLVERVKQSTVMLEDAERQTLAFVSQHCPKGTCPLAGNSVHMDRAFLKKHMSQLEAWFLYRNVDVSTIKELAQRWYPEQYKARPKKQGDHRALKDVMDSIEELRFYRDRLFVQG